MKNLFLFLRCPSTTQSKANVSIIISTILYFIVPLLLSTVLFIISELQGNNSLIRIAPVDHNIYKLFIAVILEEISFRLPLKDKIVYRVLSSLALSTILGQVFFFSSTRLLLRIILVLVIAGFLFLLQEWMFKYLSYPIIFYLYAAAFGLLHLANLGFISFGISSLLIGFFYCFEKTIGGILLGYLRIQVGILMPIIIHILYDLLPFIMEFFANCIVK